MIQYNWLVESTLFLCRPSTVGDYSDSNSEVSFLRWSVAFAEDLIQKVKVILSVRGKQTVLLVVPRGATPTLT